MIVMNRTAERVLGIISAIFTLFALVISAAFVSVMKFIFGNGEFRQEIENELMNDPEMDLSPEEFEMVMQMTEGFSGTVTWFLTIVLAISLITTIVGLVAIWNNKNPKLAGIMFIVAGIFAFVLSPTSIMLYIAAILAFTKKPPYTTEGEANHQSYEDSTMRPL